jgi:hypothetical protein
MSNEVLLYKGGQVHDKNIRQVVVDESITKIENDASHHCKRLVEITIHSSVTSIGSRAFCCCSNLMTIGIPPNVKLID